MANNGLMLMWVKQDDSNFHTQFRKLTKQLKHDRLILKDFTETQQTRKCNRKWSTYTEKLYKAYWIREGQV